MDDKYEKITPEEIEREIQAANLYSWEDDDHSDYDDPPSSIKNDFRCSTPVTANREFPDGFWSPNGEVFAAVGNTEEISSTAETVIIDAATYDDDHDTEAEIQDSLILSFELSEPLSSDYCTCAICDTLPFQPSPRRVARIVVVTSVIKSAPAVFPSSLKPRVVANASSATEEVLFMF
ncbi:uncharacterized protein LOC124161410 [Ischnura elegans]|uniref:uncharacterized protein LOC124161407 n=1 Tax=Ischnura elegans TaxID=197161 RepID=UPI001ED89C2C|nr:uncharacterized protein LOC124161407 [Ischnura elegans]XP_046393683.1 uncharacterized protein LOC124161410 [Ischnura elegans]